jgi:hypothetical protein
MKIAVCLIGLSRKDGEKARHWRTCVDNIKETFKGCDFYLNTYEYDQKLYFKYMAKAYFYVPKETTQRQIYIKALERIIKADFIICTRFDAHWHKKLEELNIDYNKVNILCKEKGSWNPYRFVNDNFFAFPLQYKQDFINALNYLERHPFEKKFMHHIYQPLIKTVPVHFVSDKEQSSLENEFYKLVRI